MTGTTKSDQFDGLRAEVADLRREVQTLRQLYERLFAEQQRLDAEVRRLQSLPPDDDARGDEVPVDVVVPGRGPA